MVLHAKSVVASIPSVGMVGHLRMRDGLSHVLECLVGGCAFGFMGCSNVACGYVCYAPHSLHSILTKHFPDRLRGRGQALYASIGYGIPGVLGALLGGVLSDSFGLASIYSASVFIALLACACAWRTHYLSRRDSFLN